MTAIPWVHDADFTSANTGHAAAVRYRIVGRDGTVYQDWTNTGVTESTDVPGTYFVDANVDDTWSFPLIRAWRDDTAVLRASDQLLYSEVAAASSSALAALGITPLRMAFIEAALGNWTRNGDQIVMSTLTGDYTFQVQLAPSIDDPTGATVTTLTHP